MNPYVAVLILAAFIASAMLPFALAQVSTNTFVHEESGAEIEFPADLTMADPILEPNYAQAQAYLRHFSGNYTSMTLVILAKSNPGEDISASLPLDVAPVGPIFPNGDAECENISLGPEQVAGVESWMGEWRCVQPSSPGNVTLVKSIILQSPTHGMLFLYSANGNAYAQFMPLAETAISSIRLRDAQVVPEFSTTMLLLGGSILFSLYVTRRLRKT